MARWVREGRVGPEDYVWSEGMADWARAGGIFAEQLGPVPPRVKGLVSRAPQDGAGGATPNGDLTAKARDLLRGKWGIPIAFCLLFMGLSAVINNVPFLGALAALILAGPLQLGWVIFFLSFSRRGPYEIEMLFRGFKNFGNALGVYLLVALFVFLWFFACALPGGILALLIGLAAGGAAAPVAIFLAVTFGYLPGMIAGVIAQLSYSQAMFLIADDNALGPMNAINASKDLMRGHKAKLFFLGLRFIGWALLCILTLGIGFLWLMPYMATSYACFYDDLLPPREQPQPAGDQMPASPVEDEQRPQIY